MKSQFVIHTDNLIVNNHKVSGRNVLPGLAYIDMLYQFFREKGHDPSLLELRNLTIYEPLTVEQECEVLCALHIDNSENQEGLLWNIRLEGRQQSGGCVSQDHKLYMTAEMHACSPVIFEDRLDMNLIRQSAKIMVPLSEIYEQCRHLDLIHTDFMKTEGCLYELETALILELSVHESFSDGEGFMFHPALIDGSAVGSGAWLNGREQEEGKLFLPLFYESFRASELIRSRCITRVHMESVQQTEELFSITLEFFSEMCQKIGELKQLTNKIVRDGKSANLTSANSNLSTDPMYAKEAATMQSFLRVLIAERLHITSEQVNTRVGYYEMGLDSRGLLEIVKEMEARLGVSLSPMLVFEYTNIAQLADYLACTYPQEGGLAFVAEKNTSAKNDKQASSSASVFAECPVGRGDIAIIGIAGRYPGAKSLPEFWSNLKEGKDGIREVPLSRWDWQSFEGFKSPSGKKLSRWGGFIDDPDCFDPQFFRITPREAETLDPQERLFLETCWETIEDAGYTPATLVYPKGKNKRQPVGVFVGVMHKDYTLVGADAVSQGHEFPVSLSNAPIANRVSYFCNFHGPSMTVDTVCSSSLTAVHLALESITLGECDVALAGGVNLSLHPGKYVSYGMGDMHSSDGQCRTFGKGGDGYVSGEGVGAVLLKPLHRAVEDGDHIYAVIKGSTINHVGAVSGITVPNPVAQGDMIESCLEKTGIDPRTISYMEAHGTGTSLGDPIEIQGLTRAFRQYTPDTQFCSIGSVKSNIGHAESAAGICGLHKVILQLHHKMLVPSLHSEELNPYIDFVQSPFYVQRQLEDWKQPLLMENGREVSYPRRAGISSFGATGSNAHLILEEYVPNNTQQEAPVIPITEDRPALIPLSAKTKERLQAYAGKLLEFIKTNPVDLSSLAYTLQVGREAMEERSIFLASDIVQLISKLEHFVEGHEQIEDSWHGTVKQNMESIDAFDIKPDFMLFWRTGTDTGKIAQLWTTGHEPDWRSFYDGTRIQRMSLPTYPFARERYWVPTGNSLTNGPRPAADSTNAAWIHPLLHWNTSDFWEQSFRSSFTGLEFFMSDHVIHGQRTLPGAASLEMICAAVEQATGRHMAEKGTAIRLRHVVWARPLVVSDEPVEVHIVLVPEDDGEITYEISSRPEASKEEHAVISRGSAVLLPASDAPFVDIRSLQEACNRNCLDPSQIYKAFVSIGIEYGPSHQGIERIYAGTDEVLAKLALPPSLSHTQSEFIVHPTMVDSAFQASIGLLENMDALTPKLPFAIEVFEVFQPCTSAMWAWIQYHSGSRSNDGIGENRMLDIDLCDESGSVCVRMKGLSTRIVAPEAGTNSIREPKAAGVLMLHDTWIEQDLSQDREVLNPCYDLHVILLCEQDKVTAASIEEAIEGIRCLALSVVDDRIEKRFQFYAHQVFRHIRDILTTKHLGQVFVQIVIPNHGEARLLAGLTGMLKTAQLENPAFIGQLIEIEPGEQVSGLVRKLKESHSRPLDTYIRYHKGKRWTVEWNEVESQPTEADLPWKDGGIYLITGGAGGLGLIFANEIAQAVKDATIILTGRSELSVDKQAQLMELEVLGAHFVYKQVDVTDKEAVDDLVQSICRQFGDLHGIIHSAGIISDNYILKKTGEELQNVLAPKVAGLVHLDQASKAVKLDFFVCFSSGAGVMGNPGQADYASANAFMDAYAEYRNTLSAVNQRYGHSLSINWPLWKEGGMHVSPETEELIYQSMGIIPLQTGSGIQAFYQGFASRRNRVMVIEGNMARLKAAFLGGNSDARVLPSSLFGEEINQTDSDIAQDVHIDKAVYYFKKLFSSVIKLPMNRIEAEVSMERYGIDSIIVIQLTNELEKTFGLLSKTLFFEYPTLRSLTGYFLKAHSHRIKQILGLGVEVKRAEAKAPLQESTGTTLKSRRGSGSHLGKRLASPAMEKVTGNDMRALDVAIIGVSGRYPGARTIQDFWKQLQAGRDCITEVPQDRWDHQAYFDENKGKPGKTYGKWGGFIEGVDEFDPQFFHISPREAELMDPQERLFLECVYETLEDSGYTRESLDHSKAGLGGNVGVYVGVMYEEYPLYGVQEQMMDNPVVLSGNIASIANRVSHICNFHGPSMVISTMCSSSLTAIHLGCQSLGRGECDLVVAGGVNVSIHPNKYLMLGQGQFVSSKGRCESFGQGGDGYVPGEGVGAVLLKPLAKAVADGDHIYGIIKSTAINHGGKVTGYTVPNPDAQASVVSRALKEAGIDPRTVSYIEAHGTGTSLGDPIEITGLTKSFEEYTKDKQFCAIGSVKSNIGHCESAAGIAGVTKVLLQLQHGRLVPSLHAATLNPYIDFEHTPFFVQRELAEWKRLLISIDGEEKEYPRIAGVSSFGAGGSNAHILIQEYIPKMDRDDSGHLSTKPALVVLSAKDGERLIEKAQRLLVDIEERQLSDSQLANLAYTLQVGREAMEERAALVAGSIAELQSKLKAFVAGQEDIEDMYRDGVKRNKETLSLLIADEDMALTVEMWIRKGKYTKLLELWVKGLTFDWNHLYGDLIPQRISLSTYPFARERYWVPVTRMSGNKIIETCVPETLAPSGILHPLLHHNTSDLIEQRYSSSFNGREFFFANHVVEGLPVLPGAAHLEMVRAAVDLATAALKESDTTLRLQNVVWTQPVAFNGQSVTIHIGLFPQDHGEIAYEIYSVSEQDDVEPIIHSQGIAVRGQASPASVMNLEDLQAQCGGSQFDSVSCYETFESLGIQYGPGHQGIERLFVGNGQVLAKLSLPASLAESAESYVLHPSLMDAAIQASVGFMLNLDDDGMRRRKKLSLPFALEELEIMDSCLSSMWALIRFSEGSKAGDRVEKFDIDMCDSQGQVRIRMRGFSCRTLEQKLRSDAAPEAVLPVVTKDASNTTLLLKPEWDTVLPERITAPTRSERIVITGGTPNHQSRFMKHYPAAKSLDIQSIDSTEQLVQSLLKQGDFDHVVWIASGGSSTFPATAPETGDLKTETLQAFRLIKALLQLGYGQKELQWTFITTQAQSVGAGDPINPAQAALHGLVGSMAKEYRDWKVRLLDMEADSSWPLADMLALPPDPQGEAWIYRRQEWYRQKLVPIQRYHSDESLYRNQGVYVVIGGAGGIGEAWSEYMIRTYQARIIWIGRRSIDAAIQARIDRLGALGSAPLYVKADAADLKSLQGAYEEIKQQYPRIHGVIHAAIVLLDQMLVNMDEARFQAGFAAKVDVSVQLSQVFCKEPLDFVLFFSSVNAFAKTAGQSNYASGCAFMDAFAHRLSGQWPCAVKVINWGYWGNVGIVASKVYQERMASLGIGSIEPLEAMETLEMLLSGPVDQMILMKVTKPEAMQELALNEIMIVYPNPLPSGIENLQKLIPNQNMKLRHIDAMDNGYIKQMNEFLCRLLWGQLQSMGMFTERNHVVITEVKAKIGLRDLYDKWLDETMAVLGRNQYLKRLDEDGSWMVTDQTPTDMERLWKEWDQQKVLWLEDRNVRAQVVLIEAMLRALPDILSGKQPATDFMFPNASMELVEGIYKHNLVADLFNEVLADTVVAYVQTRIEQDPDVQIRILEIGAGTGGTSSSVLQKLKPYQEHIQEYGYTDISRAFLMHAEKEYGPDHPYLTYNMFDVEAPLAGQGISAGGYDVAIATNVLHATRHIRHTLRNVKAALRNKGMLVLNEIAENSLFTHLTFGLLEGWWLYEDPALRITGSPALSPVAWQAVMEEEGFRHVQFPACSPHHLGQQIVVSESDGIIRQRQQELPHAAPSPKPDREALARTRERKMPDLLRERSRMYLKKLVGETLKLPAERIDSAEPLETYGIDSILVVRLTETLRTVLTNITSTLFFEYQTIDALVEHFLQTQKDAMISLVGLEKQAMDGEEFPRSQGDRISTPIKPALSKTGLGKSRRFAVASSSEQVKAASRPPKIQDIAIIGLSGRYPMAKHVDEFWNNLKEGKNCITEIPNERWDWKQYYEEEKGKKGSIYTKWGGFIDDIDKFDPMFFRISPREALQMDPQERLFLEVAYSSIEDAGYTPATLNSSRKIGVFVGVMNGNYPTGSSYWSIANRVSYLLNFQGPSMAVDTACSSSLTAIHLALESLYSGMSQCAIAGGVNLIVAPVHYQRLSAANMLSPGSQCRSFGEHADGFVDAESVGAIVLKPLEKAIEDGDQIYGIIKGSALNAGGKTNGYTVPNPLAQYQLISQALQRAGVHARTVSYLEAHGTGTVLGDPIEIAGMTRAFEEGTGDKQFCAIGSVKSNIGHSESASGMAGITKILMQLKHRTLVPSLHSKATNHNIDFHQTPFMIQQTLAEWKRPVVELNGQTKEFPRIAGISSFGAGGANAHIIIEEYIPDEDGRAVPTVSGRNPAAIVLSARNGERLQEQVRQLLDAISKGRFIDHDLMDIAYTLQVGREAMEERLAVYVSSIKELEEKLKAFTEGESGIENLYRGQVKGNKEALTIFTVDEELQEAMEKWIQRGKIGKLLELWVKGLHLDWNKLYGHAIWKPHRISLPTYPFAKERYWINREPKERVEGSVKSRSDDTMRHLNIELSNDQGKVCSAIKGLAFQEGALQKPSGISLFPLPDAPVVLPNSLSERSEPSISLPPIDRPVLEVESLIFHQIPPSELHKELTVSVGELREELAESLAEALYMKRSDVDMDKSFIDLGLDSIIGVEWIRVINQRFGTSLSATKVYDYPTVREFSEFLQKELSGHGQLMLLPPSPVEIPTPQPSLPGISAQEIWEAQGHFSEEAVREALAESLAEALYMKRSDVDVDKSFIDLGLDSIIGVEWIQVINKQYRISLAATKVYDYPTLREFAHYLTEYLSRQEREMNANRESPSLDDVLEKVRQGTIDIEQAEQLLNSFNP